MKAKATAKTGHDLRDQCGRLDLTANDFEDAKLLANLYRVIFVEGGEIAIKCSNETTVKVCKIEV